MPAAGGAREPQYRSAPSRCFPACAVVACPASIRHQFRRPLMFGHNFSLTFGGNFWDAAASRHVGRRKMPNMSIDWSSVDWGNVGLLSGIAFVATLISDVVLRHRFWGAILAGVLFAAAYVFLVYYPHGLAVPGLKTGVRSAPPELVLTSRPAWHETTLV